MTFMQSLQCNSYIYIVEYLICFYFINLLLKNSINKRLIICVSILSFMFSLFEVIGFSINNYMNLSGIISTTNTFIKAGFKFLANFILFFVLLAFIFEKMSNVNHPIKTSYSLKKIKKFSILVFILCFICYTLYLLSYFPGMLSFDSLFQIQQGLGMYEMTSHHPIFHTLVITLCMKLGVICFNSYEIGTAIFSLLQILFMSFTFSFTIYYLLRKGLPKILIIFSSIFYIFYPVMAIYSITMWKDVPFALMFNLLLIIVYEIIINKDNFMKSKKNLVLLSFVMLLFSLFRNNGIYIIIIGIVPIFIYCKKYWKQILICFVLVFLIYQFINGPLLNMLNIKKGSIREALSVPLQQMARVVKNERENITDEKYKEIISFINCDDIASSYNPVLSDPIKECFNDNYFSENKFKFIKLWISLGIQFPKQYIESFLCNTVGYWYPETVHTVVTRNIYNFEDGILIVQRDLINVGLLKKYDSIIEMRNIPVISMLFSIGFFVWILFISCMYCIYIRDYKKMLLYIFVFALWLTVLASPVHAEYRYIFGLFTAMPLILSCTIYRK